MADIKYDKGPVTVSIGRETSVEIPPRAFRYRLTGFLFESAKAFLLPSAMEGIRGLVNFYKDHPNLSVLVNGHTDRVGNASYNLGLSMDRSDAVAAYLKDDFDKWKRFYRGTGHSDPWGVREDQHMLSALEGENGKKFYTGPINGDPRGKTAEAVTRFQAFINSLTPSQPPLTVNGQLDDPTRQQLVRRYMGLDETTLPEKANVVSHGCGEAHNEVPTGDEVDEPRNRRVEVFMFDGPINPKPREFCLQPNGCPEYAVWKERTIETVDFSHELGTLTVSVRVVLNEQEQPVADATVHLSREGFATRKAHTDADGHCTFENLIFGEYTAIAIKAEFQSNDMVFDVGPAPTPASGGAGNQIGTPGQKPTQPRNGPIVMAPVRKVVVQFTESEPSGVDHKQGIPIDGMRVTFTGNNFFLEWSTNSIGEATPDPGLKDGDYTVSAFVTELNGSRTKQLTPIPDFTLHVAGDTRLVKPIPRPLPADPRQAIIDFALAEAKAWEDGGSNAANWDKLLTYYQTAYAPGSDRADSDPLKIAANEGNVVRKIKNREKPNDWCGIFAATCVRIAARSCVHWENGPGVQDCGRIQFGIAGVKPGDIVHFADTPAKIQERKDNYRAGLKLRQPPLSDAEIEAKVAAYSGRVDHHGLLIEIDQTAQMFKIVAGNTQEPGGPKLALRFFDGRKRDDGKVDPDHELTPFSRIDGYYVSVP
jgi:outer membrane protein OmpA-like peptidoglycan-associated protein